MLSRQLHAPDLTRALTIHPSNDLKIKCSPHVLRPSPPCPQSITVAQHPNWRFMSPRKPRVHRCSQSTTNLSVAPPTPGVYRLKTVTFSLPLSVWITITTRQNVQSAMVILTTSRTRTKSSGHFRLKLVFHDALLRSTTSMLPTRICACSCGHHTRYHVVCVLNAC